MAGWNPPRTELPSAVLPSITYPDLSTFSARLYGALVTSKPVDFEDEQADAFAEDVPGNGVKIIGASALQNAGDQVVSAGTVLPWLLTALGAPVGLVGLLVPIRESGSMLPQAALAPLIQRRTIRKWVWVTGAAVQGASAAAMALVAATTTGAAAGILILIALAVFATGRSLCSISSKDVMARTIPKGQRGQINGIATLASGVVAVTIGLGIRLLGEGAVSNIVLAWLLIGAAFAWIGGLVVYSQIREPAAEPVEEDALNWLGDSWRLLRTDAPFRKFVMMRTLLLVSALSPPFLVALAAAGGAGFGGLGIFVVAQGIARMIGGRYFGRLADRSSRRLMANGALFASLLIIALLLVAQIPGMKGSVWLYSGGFFLLALIHTGVRVGRKTYIIDMAEPDQVAEYVAVSNTAMGILLFVTGAVNAALALLGAEVALAFLALLGLVGFAVARNLPEVSARAGS